MRGLRITPNSLQDIDVITSELQLSIRVLNDDSIAIKWINLGSKPTEVDAQIFGYVGNKTKIFKEFEQIIIMPRKSEEKDDTK